MARIERLNRHPCGVQSSSGGKTGGANAKNKNAHRKHRV